MILIKIFRGMPCERGEERESLNLTSGAAGLAVSGVNADLQRESTGIPSPRESPTSRIL